MPYQYKLVTVNASTSTKKAQAAETKAKKALNKADKKRSASAKSVKKLKKAPKNESASAKATRLAKLKKAEKRKSADDKNYQRKKSAYSKASSKLSKLNKQKKYDDEIATKLEKHDSEWHNEGNCAIYPTNASKNGTKIIYILPSDSENESNSVNVTSWPADKGTPKTSYARMTDRGITVEGIITGQNGDNAHDKYVTLRKWAEECVELTYRGDIYYTHLIMSGLSRDFTDLKDDLHVSITFKYVTAASISTKSGKSKKSAKASKSKSGKRTKKYTTLTIKLGDTLWALSKKYGKSVKWLAKVNKIKDPNKIYAGKKIRVR